jgi:hypothetical protein
MMTSDRHDDTSRDVDRLDGAYQSLAVVRSLREEGVDVTGSESLAELSLMQTAIEDFRHAAESLAGRGTAPPSGAAEERSHRVVPPRAADETPRQYVERVNRITERFRALTRSPGRDRGSR